MLTLSTSTRALVVICSTSGGAMKIQNMRTPIWCLHGHVHRRDSLLFLGALVGDWVVMSEGCGV